MIRVLFILIIMLFAGYIYLQGKARDRDKEVPVFLRADNISGAHHTEIEVSLHTRFQPSQSEIEHLREDYQNLWAHLNHLYATNDIKAGKEYYTEDFYKHLCTNFKGVQEKSLERKDIKHHLHIMNWSRDGLLCTAVDSNLVFRYRYPDEREKETVATIAMVLLFQGDHWRLDAIRIMNEKNVKQLKNE